MVLPLDEAPPLLVPMLVPKPPLLEPAGPVVLPVALAPAVELELPVELPPPAEPVELPAPAVVVHAAVPVDPALLAELPWTPFTSTP